LRDAGLRASTITVKVRDSSFSTVTRQRGLTEPTDLTEPIWRAAVELARPETRGRRIRLVGVTATGFGERDQLGLFEDPGEDRRRRAVRAADELRHRFGTRVVTRARLLRTGIPAPFDRDIGTAVERRGRFDSRAVSGRRKTSGQVVEPPAQVDADDPIDGPDIDAMDLGADPPSP
jgi:hypothetical protein